MADTTTDQATSVPADPWKGTPWSQLPTEDKLERLRMVLNKMFEEGTDVPVSDIREMLK